MFFLLSGVCAAEVSTSESISCKTNDDCIVVVNVCDEAKSINKAFLNKYNDMIARIKPLIYCQNFVPAQVYEYSIAECEKFECRIRSTPIDKN